MVVALLALTIGGIAVISTRVVHQEIRKFEVDVRVPMGSPLRDYYRKQGSWTGVAPTLAAFARERHSEAVLFDAQRRVVAATIHPARMELSGDGTLTIIDGPAKKVLRGGLRIGDAGYLFLLPRDDPPTPRRALDRAFMWIFSGAALFGIVMAIAIGRWVTVPIERLTDAARRMERGDLSVRVEPEGGPELAALATGFNAMAAALDENEALRRRMVSDVAHELRAPLTNIRCELESMQDGLTSATPERIASLHEETMHLARLVDDLQELSLAEAGALEIVPQPIAVAALARRATAAMQVVTDGPEDLIVMADPTRAV